MQTFAIETEIKEGRHMGVTPEHTSPRVKVTIARAGELLDLFLGRGLRPGTAVERAGSQEESDILRSGTRKIVASLGNGRELGLAIQSCLRRGTGRRESPGMSEMPEHDESASIHPCLFCLLLGLLRQEISVRVDENGHLVDDDGLQGRAWE